jgi:hypothetical protein
MLANYRLIFQRRSFRFFWLGFTFSVLGDALTRIALTWYVYEQTKVLKQTPPPANVRGC